MRNRRRRKCRRAGKCMVIHNAYVYTAEHIFKRGDIRITDARIRQISREPLAAEEGEDSIDAGGLYAIPGLVDIHFHGAVGYDFCQASQQELQKIAEYEAGNGILAICPATMSYSEEILSGIMQKAAAYHAETGADLIGINMEGPFISPRKVGAQNPSYILPADEGMFRRLQEKSGGLIRLVDLAPEEPGAMKFIEKCAGDVRISLAHTACSYETAREAFARGASQVTHLFNAMPGLQHREPGPIPAAMEVGAEAELIADGIHVHTAMIRAAFRMFGEEKMILISDSMEATGLGDGVYQLGGQAVTVRGNKAVLTGAPETIAGSVTNLYDCMKVCVRKAGVPLEAAVRAAAENPAKSVGADRDYGRIAEGCYGNVLLVDSQLELRHVIQKGKKLTLSANHRNTV